MVTFAALLVLFSALSAQGTSEQVRLDGLTAPVQVTYDAFGIPHIHASSWPDAVRVLGYVHAGDRLWEMDMFRRTASGTTAEVVGESGLESDLLVRRLGIRRGCEAYWASGHVPAALRTEIEAYTQGVNARLKDLGADGLPAMFSALEYTPAPWTPVDCLVFLKYMGWDQSGTDTDLWLGVMVEKLGADVVNELWPLDRPYESPQVKHQVDRHEVAAQQHVAALNPIPGASAAYDALRARLEAATWLGRGGSFGSNNWAVDGSRTVSGKPILCSDPHLGFQLPSIWYTAHMSVQGENVAGVTFPGSPIVVIGHNDRIAWGMTNMQTDTVDYFVETVHPEDPAMYRHRGEWKTVETIREPVSVKGRESYELVIESTVHGPIMSRDGRTISMQWVGLGPTAELTGIWRINHAKNLNDYLEALDLLSTPALNMIYADVDGNIALHSCGDHPLRLPGQGRIPMEGESGDHDWRGMVPRTQLPLSVNPPEGYVASANARVAPVGYPHYLGWMWDPSYRMRRLDDMLGSSRGLTLDTMKAVQLDVHDKGAEVFVPILLEVLKSAPLTSFEARVLKVLQTWDYAGTPDAVAPIVWARWFTAYRDAVWADEWKGRSIEQPRGAWGYSGDNRRDPAMEVLEYLTRAHPDSRWFDDLATPAVETRDEIMCKSFRKAVEELLAERGEDLENWTWKHFNILHISSNTGVKELARDGGPVPGLTFTVNPGESGTPVGGGSSWRMIVDFSDMSSSVGVYPGGQSEDPASPHYDDLMKLWAKGEYVPLSAGSDPILHSDELVRRRVAFVP